MSQRKIMKAVIALEKKNMYFIIKTLLMKKKKNALTGRNIEPSLYVCGIAHRTC